MPNKRKYISTEYGMVNLRDGDTILHLDAEILADIYWRVFDGELTEVVRCKDCKYYYEQPRGFSPICELIKCRAEKEGFCSWGKKKDAKQ